MYRSFKSTVVQTAGLILMVRLLGKLYLTMGVFGAKHTLNNTKWTLRLIKCYQSRI